MTAEKHPTWVQYSIWWHQTISIPEHPGTLPRYTAGNILDQLGGDISRFAAKLNGEGDWGHEKKPEDYLKEPYARILIPEATVPFPPKY